MPNRREFVTGALVGGAGIIFATPALAYSGPRLRIATEAGIVNIPWSGTAEFGAPYNRYGVKGYVFGWADDPAMAELRDPNYRQPGRVKDAHEIRALQEAAAGEDGGRLVLSMEGIVLEDTEPSKPTEWEIEASEPRLG